MIKESFTGTEIKKNEKSEKKINTENIDIKKALELKPYIIGNMRILEDFRKGNSVDKEKIEETFMDMCKYFQLCGGRMTEDVSDIYRSYIRDNSSLVVRRESPESVVDIASGGEKKIHFDENVAAGRGDKYANCAIWPYGSSPVAGIKNAFLEGKSFAGPIVSLMAINLKGGNLTVEEAKDKIMNIGNISREAVRVLDGVIKKENLEFIILRLPYNFFPKEMLTKIEIEDGEKANKEKELCQFLGLLFLIIILKKEINNLFGFRTERN